MTEGTYDKDYVATHTVGYDKFEDYVLGKEDGVPRHLSGLPRSAVSRNGQLRPGQRVCRQDDINSALLWRFLHQGAILT